MKSSEIDWMTSTGRLIRIGEMTDEQIVAAISFLSRNRTRAQNCFCYPHLLAVAMDRGLLNLYSKRPFFRRLWDWWFDPYGT